MTPLLHSAAGFVLSSRTEALPVAVVEAMAHGKAIVSTRVGGIPELLHDGVDALLVDADNAPALAAAMIRVSLNTEFREQLQRACRDEFRARRYHEATVLHDVSALYRSAISPG